MVRCPNCDSIMKKRKRKNYPFGRKSKPQISHTARCVSCGYEEHIKSEPEPRKYNSRPPVVQEKSKEKTPTVYKKGGSGRTKK